MRKLTKFTLLIVAGILVLMAIFNPGPSEFKTIAADPDHPEAFEYYRESNYLIWSVYAKSKKDWDAYPDDPNIEKWIGVLGNYYHR